TGRLACHITNAAPTGFADARHCDWNRDLISLTGFSDLVFPELADERTPVGTYRGVAVYPDLGDQQCCVLGGLTRPEKDMNVNIGTGAQLCYIRSDYSFGPYECRPYLAGQFLPTITRLPGGRNLEVIMRFLKDTAETVSGMTFSEQSVWEHMRSSAAGARKSALDVSLGFFPETLGNAEGRIDNINDTNFTMAGLCAALYEKTAETYLQYYKKFTQEQDAFERLVFTGGVSRKDPLLTGSISAKIGLEKAVSPFRNEVFAGLYQIALVIDKKADSFDQTREIMEHSTIIWSGSR
ncbi:MAG: hypothetical protein K6E83_08760, partial [Clostridium sp.]|nr:hypothetical protein [Clostridium sp.]